MLKVKQNKHSDLPRVFHKSLYLLPHEVGFWQVWEMSLLQTSRKIEHLLQRSKCSIFHDVCKVIKSRMFSFFLQRWHFTHSKIYCLEGNTLLSVGINEFTKKKKSNGIVVYCIKTPIQASFINPFPNEYSCKTPPTLHI